MRRLFFVTLLAVSAIWIAACGGAANTNTNSNTNANSKPTASAPTAETLMALDKDATEKYLKGDGAAFETILSDKAVMSADGKQMGKADLVSMIKTVKCEGTSVNLSEPQLTKISDDMYVVTYKDASTGKCTENGKTMELKPMRASTLWARSGDKWQAVWHAEIPMMAAPAGEKKDEKAATAAEPKKDEKMAAATEPRKEETKPADQKAVKAEEAKPADTTAAKKDEKPAEPAKMTPSANTEALTKLHNSGWEAFKNKDAKAFEGMLASTFGFVDPMGGFSSSKDATIKEWTGQGSMKCEGITKTSFSDSFAQALSPTVEILFGKGNADGTCNGEKNGDLYQTAIYVKEGDAWKLAYMFERMPHAGM